MRRVIMLTIGWILFIAGLIFTPLPPPFAFGIFLLIGGLGILVANSRMMRRLVQSLRRRYGGLSRAIEAVEHRAPAFLRSALRRTSPKPHDRWERLKRWRHGRKQKPAPDTPDQPATPGGS